MRKVEPKTDEYAEGPSLAVKKSEPRYPTIRLDLETLPEAKDWKVGQTYRVEMEIKMVGISQSRYDNSAEFEIRQIGTEDQEEGDDESNDDDNE